MSVAPGGTIEAAQKLAEELKFKSKGKASRPTAVNVATAADHQGPALAGTSVTNPKKQDQLEWHQKVMDKTVGPGTSALPTNELWGQGQCAECPGMMAVAGDPSVKHINSGAITTNTGEPKPMCGNCVIKAQHLISAGHVDTVTDEGYQPARIHASASYVCSLLSFLIFTGL